MIHCPKFDVKKGFDALIRPLMRDIIEIKTVDLQSLKKDRQYKNSKFHNQSGYGLI